MNLLACGCERGGDCTRSTVCAMNNAIEEQVEKYDRLHDAYEASEQEVKRLITEREEIQRILSLRIYSNKENE